MLGGGVAFGLFNIVAGVLVSLHADRLAHRRRLGVLTEYFEHVLQLPCRSMARPIPAAC